MRNLVDGRDRHREVAVRTQLPAPRIVNVDADIAHDQAGGRCALVLEGGYSLEGLREGVRATLDTLGKDPTPPPASDSGATKKLIDGLVREQKQFWEI